MDTFTLTIENIYNRSENIIENVRNYIISGDYLLVETKSTNTKDEAPTVTISTGVYPLSKISSFRTTTITKKYDLND
jgi:hypothetical protein